MPELPAISPFNCAGKVLGTGFMGAVYDVEKADGSPASNLKLLFHDLHASICLADC